MNNFYKQLVDMYAADELGAETALELEQVAMGDPNLKTDMVSLKSAVDALRTIPNPEYTEESHQRILMKLYARGATVESRSPEPFHLQYQLPISG